MSSQKKLDFDKELIIKSKIGLNNFRLFLIVMAKLLGGCKYEFTNDEIKSITSTYEDKVESTYPQIYSAQMFYISGINQTSYFKILNHKYYLTYIWKFRECFFSKYKEPISR